MMAVSWEYSWLFIRTVLHVILFWAFFDLALAGRVPPEKSLFSYKDGETWSDFNDRDFVPSFLDDLVKTFENGTLYKLATELCGNSIQCLFDSLALQDVSVGLSTKRTGYVLEDDAQLLGNVFISNYSTSVFLSLYFQPFIKLTVGKCTLIQLEKNTER